MSPSATHLAVIVQSDQGIHWTAWDIPVSNRLLPAGTSPAAAPPFQGENVRGQFGWSGPCPDLGPLPAIVQVEAFATAGPLMAPPTLPAAALRQRLQRQSISSNLLEVSLESTP